MTIIQKKPDREQTKLLVSALASKIFSHISSEGELLTPVPALRLFCRERTTEPSTSNLPPSICLIGQGRKRVMLGEDAFVYDDAHYLVSALDLPLTSQIVDASPEKPFLGLSFQLDPVLMAELIMEASPLPLGKSQAEMGIAVSELTPPLLEAFLRLLDLLDSPEDIPVLSPLMVKEITYRLLTGEQGPRLRRIVSEKSHGHQIAKAIDWLKTNFTENFHVKALADRVGMSSSNFHTHFSSMTGLSPLRYQKRLRLIEARRLMLMENLDASDAAYHVGYESPSQFSREYARLFGSPPLKDLKSLRGEIFRNEEPKMAKPKAPPTPSLKLPDDQPFRH
jgi:AraC-like DNA-binding protein